MSLMAQEYLPFAVLVFVCLSIRLDRASIRNFLSVTVGALTVWVISPAHSPWGKAISLGLAAMAVAMSPLWPPLVKAMKNLPRGVEESGSKAHRLKRALTNPDPISVLHNPPDAEVDIVAVHGLGSSVETTWTHKTSGKLWLRDFLHLDFPKARIMTYRHDSGWKSQALVKDLADHGRQFLSALEGRRATEESRDRPMILVGHSFGGLLIEQALVLAKGPSADPNTQARHESLANSVAGAIFLGTPHAGSGYSFLGRLYCLFNYWEGGNPLLLGYMDPGAKETVKLEDDFLKYYPRQLSFDFHETKSNVILGIRFQMVVERDSGTRRGQECGPLDTDHFGLNKYHNREDASYIAVKDKMAEMLHGLTAKMEEDRDKLDTRELELLRNLEPCGFTATVGKRRRDLTPGTCEWIIHQQAFVTWSEQSNVLWILGNPGSGKTYIAQWLCEHIDNNKQNNLMYFFFDAKNEDAKDLRSLRKFYQTILHQLLEGIRKSRPKMKAQCFKLVRKKILQEGPGETAYVEALRELLHRASPSVLVVDALDECRDSDPATLKEWLVKITEFPNLKIVITSRSLQGIKKLSDNPLYINLQLSGVVDKLDADIERFILDRIKREGSMFPGEMPRVVEKLKSRSSGMILYARLMLEILENKVGTEEDLLDEMEQLPGTLTALYADRLNNVRDKIFASRILQWLVTCRRPLTVGGLRGVDIIGRTVWPTNRGKSKTVSPGTRFELDGGNLPEQLGKDNAGRDLFQEYLLRDLLPLVEVLDDGSVRLVHTTVSQFLLGEDVEDEGEQCPERFRVELDASHERIAMTCVTFLRWRSAPASRARGSESDSKLAFLDNKDLGEYAVLEWPGHCEKSEARIMDSDGEKAALVAFFGAETAFSAWLVARAELDSLFRAHFGLDQRKKLNPALPPPLHVAVFFNIWRLGRLFLTDTAINARDATGSTALHIAAGQGYPRIVKELLERGARMDTADASGAYPLHRAVRRGHHETLEQLLADNTSRAVVDMPDKYKFTPMHVACQLGWTRCVDILLRHDASLANENGAIETPVGLAIENGHIDAVRALLIHDPSLVQHCRRPLVQAARRGSTEMVEFLCGAGVDTSYEDPLGQTALHKACIFGSTDLVEYLLDKGGAVVDAKDKSQRTPLYFAAERGHLDAVNALLHRGADSNSLDRRKETALFKPAGNGHADVVDRLLRAGTDATILDAWQRTPLRFAAMKGHLSIIRMLLERTKIDQNLPDWVGRTVLHNAAAFLREGQEGVIDMLVEHGADPDAREQSGGTALHTAVWRPEGQPFPTDALLGRLIEHKVPIDAPDNGGRTALYYAAASRNVSAVKFLLGAGAASGGQSLHAAVRSGDLPLVQPFLDPEHMSKHDLAERDGRMNTPLHIAAARGYDAIAAALLAAGAPTRSLNADRHTPRAAAEQAKHPTTAALLREADPDFERNLETDAASFDSSQVNVQDALGRTALHMAVLLNRIDVLPQLFEARADVNVADNIGQTPLHYATQRADPAMAAALIAARAEVDVGDALGRVPLYLAAETGNEAVARALLAAGAALVAKKGWPVPLHAAALGGSAPTVRALLERGSGKEQALTAAIYLAAERGHVEAMKELLRHAEGLAAVDGLDGTGRSALFRASENGRLEIVRQLIRSGSLVYRTDKDRNMAIHLAAEEGHLEIVRVLLSELPAQVELALVKWKEALPGWPREEDYRGQGFLEALASAEAIVKDPVGQYWSADPSKWATPEERQELQTRVVAGLRTFDREDHSIPSTTLMRAVRGGHVDVVKLLLDEVPEMPLQARHYSISNALSLAASRGYTEIARLLIAAGAEINAITDSQETCLHEAAESGRTEVVELLLQNDANPDLTCLRDGYTPLHLAAAGGHESTVRALVRVAFLNAADDLGRTPLHVACLGGHDAVVDVLVDADADLDARDFERKTPLELAGDLSEKTKSRMDEQAMRQRQRRVTIH